jgi:pyridinium-3,5-bisthiocarboxylic acid mononucleotide nickel chelatase
VRTLYFDCFSGISGDMALGALVDAGADFDVIRDELAKLPLEPFDVEVLEVETAGFHGRRAAVRPAEGSVIRTYASIRALLDGAGMPRAATDLAQRIFRRLAEAEATVHRKEVDLVTFHEIGAVDSIVDIAGTALALTMLGVDRVFASAVPTGMGMTRTEHGAMPIPAPAVVELLRGAPLFSRGVPVELVTPTGAAILAATVEGYGEMPSMRVGRVGYGAGTHELGFPDLLRVLIGEAEETRSIAPSGDDVLGTAELVLETNVDDVAPEVTAFVIEQLLDAGAQDAWLVPIVMKKGRPAVTVCVLCSSDRADQMRRILFRETGTLGVRATPVAKTSLARSTTEVETRFGAVVVKVGRLDGRIVSVSPEYEDCARAAREAGVPLRDVYDEAVRVAEADHSPKASEPTSPTEPIEPGPGSDRYG